MPLFKRLSHLLTDQSTKKALYCEREKVSKENVLQIMTVWNGPLRMQNMNTHTVFGVKLIIKS